MAQSLKCNIFPEQEDLCKAADKLFIILFILLIFNFHSSDYPRLAHYLTKTISMPHDQRIALQQTIRMSELRLKWPPAK